MGGGRLHSGNVHQVRVCGFMEAGPRWGRQSLGQEDRGVIGGRVEGVRQGHLRLKTRKRTKNVKSRTRGSREDR
eukprot:4564351-Heterocapsa_arctica.AAC.1